MNIIKFFVLLYIYYFSSLQSTFYFQLLSTQYPTLTYVLDVWWIDSGITHDDDGKKSDNEFRIAKASRDHVVYNAVIASYQGRESFLKEPTPHLEFKCTPIYIHRSGGSPSTEDIRLGGKVNESYINDIKEKWESL